MAGSSFYIFGLFVKPFEAEFGWSRAQIMLSATFFSIMQGIGSVVVGRLIDRFGAKQIMISGALLIGICMWLLSRLSSLWQLYLLYGASGIGFACIGFIPSTSILFNWFKKNRGRMVGIVGIGIGVGGFIMPLIFGNILIPTVGWRNALLINGILLAAVLIPLILLVVRKTPQEMGLLPDGESVVATENGAPLQQLTTAEGLTMKGALRTSTFWLIITGGMCFGFCTMSLMQNQVAHLTDVGFSVAIAASATSVVGVFSGSGKFLFGLICDYIKPRWARLIGLVSLLAAVVILITIGGSTPVAIIYAYAVLMGLSYGSWLPTMSMLTNANFGMLAYAGILGLMSMSNMIGGAVGPVITGYIYDINQSYLVAFYVFATLLVIAIIATLFIRKPVRKKPE
jgi:sugar phosphate permease